MTYPISFLALALASSPPAPDCSHPLVPRSERRVYTNADLERMTACRYQTGAQSEAGSRRPMEESDRPRGKVAKAAGPPDTAGRDALESDWRAQWRAVDQKARRLRREARELRQEAGEAPRDAKKPATGRRSPSLLLNRARSLEAEARELEEEFQDRARREGALPGWLRPKAR